MPGDVILAADGTDLLNMELDEAKQLVKGEEGSFVSLTIQHADGTQEEVSVQRRTVEVETVYAEQIGEIGYISIANFNQGVAEHFKMCIRDSLRSVKDPRVNQGLISVTSVNTTGDMRWCKVYLSVYGLQSEKEFMKGLKSASGWLRHEIGTRLRLRNVPEFVFELDHSIEHGAHINQVIHDLHIPEDSDETDTE